MQNQHAIVPALLTVAVAMAIVTATSIFAADKAETKTPAPVTKPKTGGMVYKKEPRLTIGIYFPENWKKTDKRSALVIFRCNIPEQREHFRKLGMVIIKPQTAGVNSGKLPGMTLEEIAKMPKPRMQVEDTKSAIRFIRENASKLGIDPNRIVATGTSGGGDLALQAYINKSFEDEQDNKAISHKPDGLLLYCPAFDGIDIWFVKMDALMQRTKAEAPAFVPHLEQFIRNTTDEYATPRTHRADLIKLAGTLGQEKKIDETQIKAFEEILLMFNKRDWQLLHPFQEALKMSASRILTKEPLPPTLIMYGTRDHLRPHQEAFVAKAKAMGQKFELKVFEGAGHSFMMQPAFEGVSTKVAEEFFKKWKFLPSTGE